MITHIDKIAYKTNPSSKSYNASNEEEKTDMVFRSLSFAPLAGAF